MIGVRPFVKLRTTLSGEIDPATGYLCNIKIIDQLVQDQVVDPLTSAVADGKQASEMTSLAFQWIESNLPEKLVLESVELILTPYLKYCRKSGIEAMSQVTQQFEFSATHRLHCKHLSDEENRKLFGKCNNPHGHGHNYVVEVTAGVPDEQDANVLQELETVVMSKVIDRFDHKNLNVETEEFATLNPTVENISTVVWNLLDGQLSHSQLVNVRVFETPKTWADFSG